MHIVLFQAKATNFDNNTKTSKTDTNREYHIIIAYNI